MRTRLRLRMNRSPLNKVGAQHVSAIRATTIVNTLVSEVNVVIPARNRSSRIVTHAYAEDDEIMQTIRTTKVAAYAV